MRRSRYVVIGLVTSAAATSAALLLSRRPGRSTRPGGRPGLPSDQPAGPADTGPATEADAAEEDHEVEGADGRPGHVADTPGPLTPDTAQREGRGRHVVRSVAGAVGLLSLVALLVVGMVSAGLLPSRDVGASEVLVGAIDATGSVARPGPTATAVPPSDTRSTVRQGSTAVAPSAGDAGRVERADPATVSIPAIDVDASVIPLGVTDSSLDVPEDFAETGWWQDGPEPGEVGAAVVVGHVDSFRGPAVFFRLRDLVAGDEITIDRVDGSSATFAVRSIMRVSKDDFPTEMVYGATTEPWLRLITCDGDFADGSYLGNLIVNAELVHEQPPATNGALA
ncbi:sortase domain-bontaining protein [Euzebya rosea]|uniref:sortase domain-containing protein n=1 Tax=Euzebya rosea TaxID=2052804 RepID=UPI00196A9F71|nr:sortase [Euzebya rosea]